MLLVTLDLDSHCLIRTSLVQPKPNRFCKSALKMRVLLIFVVTCVALCLGCEKGADCGHDECCVKRDGGNLCQPLASEGKECHILFGIFPLGKPEDVVSSCPCQMGLTCMTDDPKLSAVEGSQGTCRLLLLS